MNYSLKIGKIYKITEENFDENLGYLPKARQEHVLKFKDRNRQKQSLVATLLLEECLKELGALDLYNDVIEDENGQWIIKDSDIHFSISHCNETVLVAAARFPIGCDIELVKEAKMDIAKRFFSENEVKQIETSDRPELVFYAYWTIKESYLKLTGKGLLGSIEDVEVDDSLTMIKNHPELKVESVFLNDYVMSVVYEKR